MTSNNQNLRRYFLKILRNLRNEFKVFICKKGILSIGGPIYKSFGFQLDKESKQTCWVGFRFRKNKNTNTYDHIVTR